MEVILETSFTHLTTGLNALGTLIASQVTDEPPTEIKIYTFDGEGFRISEIDCIWRRDTSVSGSSFMRSDFDAHAMILACESYVLVHGEPVVVYDGSYGKFYDPTLYDPEQEARQAVLYHFHGGDESKLPDWEERYPPDFKVPEGMVLFDKSKTMEENLELHPELRENT